jgi:hypothetical protein
VQDTAFPYLVFDADSGPLPWTHGSLLALRLGARFMRITPRGLHYSQHAPLALDTSAFHSVGCAPSSGALCEETGGSRMLYFSTGSVDLPDDWRTLYPNEFIRRFPNGSSCSSDYTGRVIKTADRQYEVSLCDLLDSNLDIVLDTQQQRLYWREDSTGTLDYVFVAVLAVYLISVVSQNMVRAMTHEPAPGAWLPRRHVENLVVLVVLGYTYVCVRRSQCVFLTHADAALYLHLCALSVVYWVMNVAAAGRGRAARTRRHDVSLFTTCLLLLLMRVYQTVDMPYLVALVYLFGSRFVFKLVSCLLSAADCRGWGSGLDYALLLGEAFVFASLLGSAVWVGQRHAVQAAALQTLLLVACWLTGVFMYLYGLVYGQAKPG